MRKAGDRLREIKEKLKLIQPLGKIRLVILGIEVFLLLLIFGVLIEYMCIKYIIVVFLLSAIYVLIILIDTLNK